MLNIFKTKKTSHLLAAVCVFICILFGALSLQYYSQLQKTIKTESSEYLQEVSKQISYNASRTIDANFSVLGTISTVLKNAGVSNYQQFQDIVQEQKQFWNYENILLIDKNSNAYDAYGKKTALGNDLSLQEAILENKRSLSTSKVVDGKEYTVFIIPVAGGINIDGVPIEALAAMYDSRTFDRILALKAFDDKAYAHIISNNGTMVIRSSSPNATRTGYNLINTLDKATIDDGSSVQKMKQDLRDGTSGFISYKLDNIAKYMVYTPLSDKEWSIATVVPVDAVSAKSQIFLKATLGICGFITLTFTVLLIVILRSAHQHRQKLEQIAYVDPVTKGNTIQKFTELTEHRLQHKNKQSCAIIFTNIEKFKVLNEQFGRHACDNMLQHIYAGISADLRDNEFIGRVAADNFCILVDYKDEEQLAERFTNWYNQILQRSEASGFWLSPMLEFGIYLVDDEQLEVLSMLDRAKIALLESTPELRGRLRYSFYNDRIGKKLLRERYLEELMETALAEHEFQVYLQPKYAVNSEQIAGAEALVRWRSKKEGFIYPDEFIPLFERNGFVIPLDLYVFETVCCTIKKWIDAGQEPIKISVNCSRVQMKKPNFLENYKEIAQRFQVPLHYLEIELTESMVFEDVERLSEVIQQIRAAGFGCSMDDFGSGYSSLNLIQDIPVDTIKLDKVFFKGTARDLLRTESVIGCIITMSRSLNMNTVAEGVESLEHVEMLKRLKCGLIQGYYYAKPMPIAEFEVLKFGTEILLSLTKDKL